MSIYIENLNKSDFYAAYRPVDRRIAHPRHRLQQLTDDQFTQLKVQYDNCPTEEPISTLDQMADCITHGIRCVYANESNFSNCVKMSTARENWIALQQSPQINNRFTKVVQPRPKPKAAAQRTTTAHDPTNSNIPPRPDRPTPGDPNTRNYYES